MIPRFSGKYVSCRDLDPHSDEEWTAHSLQEVEQYAAEVERVHCCSSTHWDIAIPALRLHPDKKSDTAAADLECLLSSIDKLYACGGSVTSVDCSAMSAALATIVLARISSLHEQQNQKQTKSVSFISFRGMLRTQSAVSSIFDGDCSVAVLAKSVDLSGNKLRDQVIAHAIERLMDKNIVEELNLDDNVIGSRSCALLCRWLRSGDKEGGRGGGKGVCSLKKLSVRNTGLFVPGFGPGGAGE